MRGGSLLRGVDCDCLRLAVAMTTIEVQTEAPRRQRPTTRDVRERHRRAAGRHADRADRGDRHAGLQSLRGHRRADARRRDVAVHVQGRGRRARTFAAATFASAPRGGDTTRDRDVRRRARDERGSTSSSRVGSSAKGAPQNSPALFANATLGSDAHEHAGDRVPARQDGRAAQHPVDRVAVDDRAKRSVPPRRGRRSTSRSISTRSPRTRSSPTTTGRTSPRAPRATPITITVEGLAQASPATKYASAPVTLNMSHDKIDNTAIYWWASSQGSLMTQTFGQTGAPTLVKNNCTSCHSVSRSGSRIGYCRCVDGDCGQLYAGFMKYDTTNKVVDRHAQRRQRDAPGSYTTFSPIGYPFPDDKQSVALVTLVGGHLTLSIPDTGTRVASNVDTVSTHGPRNPGRCATMPDWSPDGKTIVFASTPHAGQWIDVSNSAIATMTYTYAGSTHTFGEPTIIVPGRSRSTSGTYNNFFFPSFSPDGKLHRVQRRARGVAQLHGRARRPGERLMITNPTGAWAIELAGFNGSGDLDITWPHWAPANKQRLLLDRVLERARLRPRGHASRTPRPRASRTASSSASRSGSARSARTTLSAKPRPTIRARRRCGCPVRTSAPTTSARTGRSRRADIPQ